MKQIPCLKHEGSFLLYLNIEKEKVEYMCDFCYQELEFLAPCLNTSNIIHIKTLLQSPEHLISKLNIQNSLKEFFTFLDKINDKTIHNIFDEFNNSLINLQTTLEKVQKELQNDVKSIKDMKQNIRDKLNEVIKIDSFKQQIAKLEQLGDSYNLQTIKENELALYKHIQDLTRNDSEELNNTLKEIICGIKQQFQKQNQQEYPEYKNFQESLKSFDYQQLVFINKVIQLQNEQKLLSLYQKQKIINFILRYNQTKKLSLNQIYLGTRDGLNIQTFWKKVNKKNNLLMIFQSNSGYIFGGYSPCNWEKSSGSYAIDNSYSSFLFSETHDEIYPLKFGSNSHAIYCAEQLGPIFGAGHDLYIGADFQGGSSNSLSYDFGKKQNLKTHLFGQQTPNIQECEIFQVLFD